MNRGDALLEISSWVGDIARLYSTCCALTRPGLVPSHHKQEEKRKTDFHVYGFSTTLAFQPCTEKSLALELSMTGTAQADLEPRATLLPHPPESGLQACATMLGFYSNFTS